MLPKKSRLNLRFEFKRVAAGKTYRTTHLKLFYIYEEHPLPLVGISIPRKLYPKAHQRNAVKRLISSALQKLYNSLRKDLSLVIMPQGVDDLTTQQEIEQELNHVNSLYSRH